MVEVKEVCKTLNTEELQDRVMVTLPGTGALELLKHTRDILYRGVEKTIPKMFQHMRSTIRMEDVTHIAHVRKRIQSRRARKSTIDHLFTLKEIIKKK